MAAGHLVADADLTFLRHVDLGHLDDAGGQFVADGNGELLAFQHGVHDVVFLQIVDDQLPDEFVGMFVVRPIAQLHGGVVQAVQNALAELGSLGDDLRTDIVLDALRRLVLDEGQQLVNHQGFQFGGLLCEVVVEFLEFHLVCGLGRTVLDGLGEQALSDNDARERRIGLEGSVFHVAGLVAENGAQQLLLRRGIALALRRDFTNQDVTGIYTGTDANDTVVVEVLRSVLAHVGDVVGQFLHAALGLTDFE